MRLARGEISDEELNAARSGVASDLRSLTDIQGELEGFTLSQVLDGSDCSPMELAELAEYVSREDVAAIASGVELDLVYFLTGGGEADDEEDESDAEA